MNRLAGIVHRSMVLGILFSLQYVQIGRAAAQEVEDRSDLQAEHLSGPKVTVHGVVLNASSGEPLAHALVSTRSDPALGALTDSQGRFEIANVPTGVNLFAIRKPGFRDVRSGEGAESSISARVAEKMPDMVFTLHPVCTIDGEIQLSSGDPAAAFAIDLLHLSVKYGRLEWKEIRYGSTDEQGSFHFSALEPGIYTLHSRAHLENPTISPAVNPASVRDIQRSGYPGVYYPDASTVAGAGQIHLKPGEHATADLSLSLEPFYPVTLAVREPDGQPFRPDLTSDVARHNGPVAIDILNADNLHSGYMGRYDQDSGTVQADLPNGTYVVRVFVNGQVAGRAAMGGSHAGYLMGVGPLTVNGRALRDLPLTLFAPTSQLLRVHRPTAGVAPQFSGVYRVWLSPAGDPLTSKDSQMDARRDGEDFDLMYNPLSPQWLHTSTGNGFCAGTLTGGEVSPGREPIVSNPSGSHPPIDLQLRNDCAQLTLTLPSAATADSPGVLPHYTVYVVPDFETTEEAAVREVSAPELPRVVLKWLTPGAYRVYTFAEPVELPYLDSAAMAAMQLTSQSITLAPGDKAELTLELPSRP